MARPVRKGNLTSSRPRKDEFGSIQIDPSGVS